MLRSLVPVYNAIQPLSYVIQPGKPLSSMSMSRTYIKIKFRGKDDHTISNTDSTRQDHSTQFSGINNLAKSNKGDNSMG